jgi:hypothetical protein
MLYVEWRCGNSWIDFTSEFRTIYRLLLCAPKSKTKQTIPWIEEHPPESGVDCVEHITSMRKWLAIFPNNTTNRKPWHTHTHTHSWCAIGWMDVEGYQSVQLNNNLSRKEIAIKLPLSQKLWIDWNWDLINVGLLCCARPRLIERARTQKT